MTMGGGIFCVVCGARPGPELGPPDMREDFDLVKLDHRGASGRDPASGEWFCSRRFECVGRNYQVTAEWIWANEEPVPDVMIGHEKDAWRALACPKKRAAS
jgi:hypothetical protein